MATWRSLPITVAPAGSRSNNNTRCSCPAHAPSLCFPHLFSNPTLTLVFFISESFPHDFHDPQSWRNPSMTNILFKPTLPVRTPLSFPLKPHHLIHSLFVVLR